MAGVNPAYFSNLTDKVNAVAANTSKTEAEICADIGAFEAEIMAEFNSLIAGVRAQLLSLLPMLTLPTDLGSCIAWITNAAQPYIKAYDAAEADLAQVLAGAAALEAAIQNLAGSLTSCSITPTPVV